MEMKLLDLFSGIGGFSLSAQWVWGDELEIAGFCEIEKYCQKVLKKNFPNVPIYEDIIKLDGNQFSNIDLITGGFPCTDISIAGKGKSLIDEKGNKTRSGLWFEMHRIIREVRPRYALIENVPMLTIRGGTRVISDLAEIGYDCSWTIISANQLGARHRRKRIWIVAYPHSHRLQRGNTKNKKSSNQIQTKTSNFQKLDCSRHWGQKNLLSRSVFCRNLNGIPGGVDRIKGLGNAIVPQVAMVIMERIKKIMEV